MHHWRQSQCHLDTSTWICCELIESPPPSKHQLLGNMEWIDCLHCFTCNCFSPFLKYAVHSFPTTVKAYVSFKAETFSFRMDNYSDKPHIYILTYFLSMSCAEQNNNKYKGPHGREFSLWMSILYIFDTMRDKYQDLIKIAK